MDTAIADLNDRFRKGDMTLGQYIMTDGVSKLAQEKKEKLAQMVQNFNGFNPNNDPYGERDFGTVTLAGEEFFWKIDYYDPTLKHHSSNPASPNATKRVLLLMKTDEY